MLIFLMTVNGQNRYNLKDQKVNYYHAADDDQPAKGYISEVHAPPVIRTRTHSVVVTETVRIKPSETTSSVEEEL